MALLAAGAAVAMLAVRGVDRSASREIPAAERSLPAPAVSCPDPVTAPPASCPPALAPAAPPRPELTSSDHHAVLEHGFPALSADGGEVAVVRRGAAGEISLEILESKTEGRRESLSILEPGELAHAPGGSLADRISAPCPAPSSA